MKHTIWSDIVFDFESWERDLREDYPDMSEDEIFSATKNIGNLIARVYGWE